MKKKLLSMAAVIAICVFTGLNAQTDVTSTYLSNPGFETDPIMATTTSAEPSNNTIHFITGWDAAIPSGGFTKLFTLPYNTLKANISNTLNVDVPSNGTSETTDNNYLLAIKTHWNDAENYIQKTVTLPAGTYTLKWDSYVMQNISSAASYCGIVIDAASSYLPLGTSLDTWENRKLHFELEAEATVIIRFGYKKTVNTGGGESPVLFVDNVKLLLGVDKTDLDSKIAEALALVGDDTGDAATELNAVIASAQGVASNASASQSQVTQAITDLETAILNYQLANATETNPLDMTSYIVNPNFSNGTTGWSSTAGASNKGTVTNQNVGAFEGTMPFWEHWNASAYTGKMYQVVNNLPAGRYTLEMGVFANNGGDGLYVYAGDSETAVSEASTPAIFTTNTAISAGTLEIGLNIKSGTNNWVGIDNVKLYYTGPLVDPALGVSVTETILLSEANPTATFTVNGSNLIDEVNVVSSNAAVVPDVASISIAEAEAGKVVNLTFDGTVTDNVTITVSSGSLTKTVNVATSYDSGCFTKMSGYESETNLIPDPFVLNSAFAGWGNRELVINKDIAYCGATCARIFGGSYDVALSSYEANTTYIASAWINPNGNNSIRFGAHGLGVADQFTNLTSGSSVYELVTLEFTPGANPGTVSLHFNGAGSSGAYIDNIQVYKKNTASSTEKLSTDAILISPIQGGMKITSAEAVNVGIFSVTGQLVKNSTVSGSIDIALNKGLYIVKAGNETQKVIVR